MDWISTLKVADLKEELRKRQLPVSGKKQELVERLAAVVADEPAQVANDANDTSPAAQDLENPVDQDAPAIRPSKLDNQQLEPAGHPNHELAGAPESAAADRAVAETGGVDTAEPQQHATAEDTEQILKPDASTDGPSDAAPSATAASPAASPTAGVAAASEAADTPASARALAATPTSPAHPAQPAPVHEPAPAEAGDLPDAATAEPAPAEDAAAAEAAPPAAATADAAGAAASEPQGTAPTSTPAPTAPTADAAPSADDELELDYEMDVEVEPRPQPTPPSQQTPPTQTTSSPPAASTATDSKPQPDRKRKLSPAPADAAAAAAVPDHKASNEGPPPAKLLKPSARTPAPRKQPPKQALITAALKVEPFVRPLREVSVRELLAKHGKLADLWMPGIKTHCIAVFEDEQQAEACFRALYDLPWQEGRRLKPYFIPVEKARNEISAGRGEPVAPKAAAVVAAPAAAAAVGPRANPGPAGLAAAAAVQRPGVQPSPQQQQPRVGVLDPRRMPAMAKKVPEAALSLEDLFRKTTCKPRLFFLPLTDEQVAAKKAKEAAAEAAAAAGGAAGKVQQGGAAQAGLADQKVRAVSADRGRDLRRELRGRGSEFRGREREDERRGRGPRW